MQVEVNGRPVVYHAEGIGEPLVFIHAFPLNGEMWRPQIAELVEDYKTITFDLPGFGDSPPAKETSSMESYASTIAAILDDANVRQPAVFVGLSMGGYILFEFFRRFPERVRGLVLANTRAQPDTEESKQERERTARRVLQDGPGVVAESMLPKLLSPEASDDLRAQVRSMIMAASPEGIAGALRAMADRPDSQPTLADFNLPVLVIAGEQDGITPPADAEAMADEIAGSSLEVIEGAGHLSNLEQPHAFNAALRRYLDDLEEDERNAPNQPI